MKTLPALFTELPYRLNGTVIAFTFASEEFNG